MSDFIKKYGWIFIVALLGVLIVVGLTREPSPVEVESVASWHDSPTVIVCPSSPFSLEEVEEAVNRYKSRGHQFEGVIDLSSCPDSNITGWIMIKGASQNINFDKAGRALTSYDSATGEILSSSIEIFSSINMLVLEHELGHALGYKHVTRNGHIMYPNTSGLGSNDEGLYVDITEPE